MCGCNEKNSRYGNVYEITEFLKDDVYGRYMNDDGKIFTRLQDFKSKLENSSDFTFYAYDNNFIEVINEEIPETCLVNYGSDYVGESKYEIDNESISAVEAIQVSKNYFDLFPAEIAEGRGLEDSDFVNSDNFPVLLGNAYKDHFKVGDSFEGYYVTERKTFTVIGFIETDHSFYLKSKNSLDSYDNYLVVPFIEVEDSSFFSRIILLQGVCGFIESSEDRNVIAQTINEYLKEADLEKLVGMIVINKNSIKDKLNGNR